VPGGWWCGSGEFGTKRLPTIFISYLFLNEIFFTVTWSLV
jgi:hypothetical protein